MGFGVWTSILILKKGRNRNVLTYKQQHLADSFIRRRKSGKHFGGYTSNTHGRGCDRSFLFGNACVERNGSSSSCRVIDVDDCYDIDDEDDDYDSLDSRGDGDDKDDDDYDSQDRFDDDCDVDYGGYDDANVGICDERFPLAKFCVTKETLVVVVVVVVGLDNAAEDGHDKENDDYDDGDNEDYDGG